jgi:hypothetical protein
MEVGGEPLFMGAESHYSLNRGMAFPQSQLDVLKKR